MIFSVSASEAIISVLCKTNSGKKYKDEVILITDEVGSLSSKEIKCASLQTATQRLKMLADRLRR